MADRYDEELLLDDVPPPRWSFPSRVLLVVSFVAFAGLALFSVRGVATTTAGLRKSGNLMSLDEVDPLDAEDDTVPKVNCFEEGMFYASPAKMEATERTVELSAELCQQRCQVVPECAHFTFWPDGGCLLTSDMSSIKAAPVKYSSTVIGPKYCPGAIQAGKDGVSDATDAEDATVAAVASAGVDQAESAWGASADVKKVVATVSAGVNGTMCSAYPACVDVGIKEGDCCPNAESVTLGCCNGFPKKVEEVIIKEGTECSIYPKCVALNITGGCCPTREGLMLGCCETL